MHTAGCKTGVHMDATCNTLRHSFATHLLEGDQDIRTIQELLGYKDPRTTSICTRVLKRRGRGEPKLLVSLLRNALTGGAFCLNPVALRGFERVHRLSGFIFDRSGCTYHDTLRFARFWLGDCLEKQCLIST